MSAEYQDNRARQRLIRDAATREADGEDFRDRMDAWMDTQRLRIRWHIPVRTYETNWGKLFSSFVSNI